MINVKEQKQGQTTRLSFSRTRNTLELPNLVEVQTKSYKWFLEEGLREVLHDVSPITDFSGKWALDFVDYELDVNSPTIYSVEESKERDTNYAAPMKLKVRLQSLENGYHAESMIHVGDFPLMTDNGTFVINGAERVIVSQIIRSPGMYYESAIDKSGKKTYAATVIPYRGAWLEYEVDINDKFQVRIDKNRKVPVTTLIRALSSGDGKEEEIKELFGEDETLLNNTIKSDECFERASQLGTTPQIEALKEIYRKLRPGEPIEKDVSPAKTLLHNYFFDPKRYDIAPVGRYKFDKKMALDNRVTGRRLAETVVSPLTGEILFEEGAVLSRTDATSLQKAGVNDVKIKLDNGHVLKVISNNTIYPEDLLGYNLKDCGVNERCYIPALLAIMEEAGNDKEQIKKLARQNISSLCPKCLTIDDFYASISYMIGLTYDVGHVDDIDHLGNRRIRSVGEQLQNQMRIGFARMDKMIKERMSTLENEKMSPESLVNVRPITTAVREFFGSSQLSQFMDQNNPLAELTHKRRLSALGPGGLSRDRASFEVRDVHYTHYGRMCPIETPEGPNIGLISYLTTYARISDYGFIEAPYRRIDHVKLADGTIDHVVTDEVEYMTADLEDKFVIAQANEPLDENNHFVHEKITVHDKNVFREASADEIDYMDVSPKMIVSVATAMIPFLENDDNTRALMGSNMQKQAVPLMVTDSPIVGTGMEYKAAVDSGVVICATNDGVVEYVDATRIVITRGNGMKDEYKLLKFKRTNQGTCFNQRPIVRVGQTVEAGQVIADGPATSKGEVSLGKNALVGFMTWEGYNYEDAVLLNERLVREDMYTSLHIEEYTIEARDTKLGAEIITREIPNVSEDALKDLGPDGIVKKGTEVRAGDILVGKITPKGETELTPEERLLRAIFGDKAREVRDTSLHLPHGESGVVVDVREFNRENGDKNLQAGVNKSVKVYIAQKRKISVGDKMAGRHGNKGVVSRILPPEDMPFLADGTPLDIVLNPLGVPSRMNIGQVLEVHLGIAARKLGWKIMTPVFDGANEKEISECLKQAGLWRDLFPLENPEGKELFEEIVGADGKPELRLLSDEERSNASYLKSLSNAKKLKVADGKAKLFDGRTGEAFDNPVTVGIMYYLKLHHLVDDKIHARSNGPYSLVTQQPLGGKAQFGGQRFGEMEVWALEAYGAAYTLQEILTVKSDDIIGRRKVYEAIIKGQNIPTPGVPESFKVLVKELQSLGLDIRVLDNANKEVQLSTLCNEDDVPASADKSLRDLVDDVTGNTVSDYNRDTAMFLDADGNPEEEEPTEEQLFETDESIADDVD